MTYRTTYRKAMERASKTPGSWVEAKRVEDAVQAIAYLRRTYPKFDWSYWARSGEQMVTCRYIHRPEQG